MRKTITVTKLLFAAVPCLAGLPGVATSATFDVTCSTGGGTNCSGNISNSLVLVSTLTLDANDCPSVVTDVNVAVELSHGYVPELVVTLTHSGQEVRLFNEQCSGPAPNGMDLVFDDDSGGLACSSGTLSGDVAPFEPLSTFYDAFTEGDWSLEIADNGGSGTGSLTDWSLHLTCEPAVEPSVLRIEGGYFQADTTDGAAPRPSHCSDPVHYGRIVYDDQNDNLYVCNSSGWNIH